MRLPSLLRPPSFLHTHSQMELYGKALACIGLEARITCVRVNCHDPQALLYRPHALPTCVPVLVKCVGMLLGVEVTDVGVLMDLAICLARHVPPKQAALRPFELQRQMQQCVYKIQQCLSNHCKIPPLYQNDRLTAHSPVGAETLSLTFVSRGFDMSSFTILSKGV